MSEIALVWPMIAAINHEKFIILGGMDKNKKPSRKVSILDLRESVIET